jgi:glycosyltransferase involved in cell wall biosynthesis
MAGNLTVEDRRGRPRILHVVAPAEVGGLERVVHALAVGTLRLGHPVGVVVVLDRGAGNHPFVEKLHRDGVECFPIRLAPRAYLRERAHLADVCAKFYPDLIHTHGYRPDILSRGVAHRLGIPIVSTAHGFIGYSWKGRLYEWLERRSLRRFDAVVAVSRPLQERLASSGIPTTILHFIRNGWEAGPELLDRTAAREALGLPIDGYRIGWVGRLSREKGPDLMLDALALLNDVPVALSMIGGGPEQSALEARAGTRGLAARVRWHGVVQNAGRFMRAFDQFVLSSRTEGTPMVLFEAMEAGVPIVAAAVGGVPDVITASQGLLVPSEAADQLACAIREVWSHPDPARRRADSALERLATEFGVAPWLEQYVALYSGVIRG